MKKGNKNQFFVQKNEVEISGFAVAKKALSPWKKSFFEKKLQAYLCRYDLQKDMRNFF